MTRSSSAEPAKQSKRKGTRSVSTLTPSQLARKRANDREAQRAIRARTKEHIERLEQELDDLRSTQSRDKTVQDLLRRNKALEDELRQLKESMGVSMNSSPYSAPAVYEEGLSNSIPSPRMSPLPSGAAEYSISDYNQAQQYVPMPNCENWASQLPSSVPSPSSSVNTDEYGPAAAYIPTSVPNNMMGGMPKEVKLEFEDMQQMMAAQGYLQQQSQQRPQSWNMYPGMYFDGSQNAALMTR